MPLQRWCPLWKRNENEDGQSVTDVERFDVCDVWHVRLDLWFFPLFFLNLMFFWTEMFVATIRMPTNCELFFLEWRWGKSARLRETRCLWCTAREIETFMCFSPLNCGNTCWVSYDANAGSEKKHVWNRKSVDAPGETWCIYRTVETRSLIVSMGISISCLTLFLCT